MIFMLTNNSTKRQIIETLCCVALGGLVMIGMASMVNGLYGFLTGAVEQIQEQQEEQYDILNEVM